MAQINEKYTTILNNLLDVQPNDSSIFTKIDNKNFFDIKNMLADEEYQKIINEEKFEITLLDGTLLEYMNLIKQTNSIEELKNLVYNKNVRKLNLKRIVESKLDLETIKRNIVNLIELKIQNSVSLWKLLNSNTTSILEETNIWPLHIGFMFISLRIDEKVIYAPLFFKEVEIKFKNGKPFLTSEGDIKINEKIMFFLKNNGLNLHVDSNLNENRISELVNILKNDWENLFSLPKKIFENFEIKGSPEIDNENILFHPGTILGIFQPSGGYSRNRMKEIIEKDEIDNIIKVEINKNIYKDRINKYLNNPEISIFKITPSNLSQDKAIISSLNQHTIIWGPPGTGKSQTIVNLLTNILVYNKTAIVASQKKAALNVIKNRLGSLQDFCLFILKSKNVNKKLFYEPIKKYLDLLENFQNPIISNGTPIINQKELEYIKNVDGLLNHKNIKNILYAYYYLSKYKENPNYANDSEFLINLPFDIMYPQQKITSENITKSLLKENKLRFMWFFSKYHRVKKIAEEIKNYFPFFEGNFSNLVGFFHQISGTEENGKLISELIKIINLSNEIDFHQEISDEKIIHKIIAERINNKFTQMNENEIKEYQEFAQHVRVQNLEPYRFVKKFAKIIKIIYPIIVATPDTDLASWDKEELDYAILDESSQIFIEKGLPILYLAKTKILAGDPEQMRPSNWFGSRSTDDTIFGKVDSLLDYASSLNVTQILLDKNYRSKHAALMSFSSKYFYNSQLDVVDANINSFEDAIEVYEVDGIWKDSKNIEEANKAIQILKENVNKYKKTILLAFNISQSEYLTNLILNNHPDLEEAINDKKLLIKNIENIQGDEADLVVATVSYDKNTKLSSTYICRPTGKNALNVAISRAKEKMIVIKTIKSSDISLGENHTDDMKIFKEWLRFLEKPADQKRSEVYDSFNKQIQNNNLNLFKYVKSDEQSTLDFDENSQWFKKFVLDSIKSSISNKKEYELFEEYNVGSIKIDLVITKNQKPYKCFIFDTFNYENSTQKYMLIRDRFRFLVSKNYDVQIINPISWMQIQNRLNGWFKQNNLNDEAVNYHPTSTYILNKSSLDEFKETSHQNIAELNKIHENAEKNIISTFKDPQSTNYSNTQNNTTTFNETIITDNISFGFSNTNTVKKSLITSDETLNETQEDNQQEYEQSQILMQQEYLGNNVIKNLDNEAEMNKTYAEVENDVADEILNDELDLSSFSELNQLEIENNIEYSDNQIAQNEIGVKTEQANDEFIKEAKGLLFEQKEMSTREFDVFLSFDNEEQQQEEEEEFDHKYDQYQENNKEYEYFDFNYENDILSNENKVDDQNNVTLINEAKNDEVTIEDEQEPFDQNMVHDEISKILNENNDIVYNDDELNQETEPHIPEHSLTLDDQNESANEENEDIQQEHKENLNEDIDQKFLNLFNNDPDETKTTEIEAPMFKTYENKFGLTSTWFNYDNEEEEDEH
ncbi:DEAD/DEAH box helicase [Mycoplasmopsis cynos]|uniref:Uncharacterized protein n=1 Tax=Mycoplasmopsis cynos TaxID=171284 RepID=A0A449AIF1_9BACT|nr:DEAD/DEAH box helicase [Mycoplasmopsis cynos]TQC54666.1 ATP-dependent helicase [Mycoplasmopsis cynos]VEU64761.1 Uncharacterised protein [Mycoplasmopsis cynos]